MSGVWCADALVQRSYACLGRGIRRAARDGPLFDLARRTANGPAGLSPSGDRRSGRVAVLRFGIGRLKREPRSVPPIPLDTRAEGKGHGRKDRHGHGEARQDRLHRNHLDDRTRVLDSGDRAVFRGRSLALRPRLTTGLPWTVIQHEADFASVRRTLGAIGHEGHTPVVLVGPDCGVSAWTHHPPGSIRQARRGPLLRAASTSVRGRASRPRPRWLRRCRSARRRC